ncbi:GntR family transcriptional regulator [Pseudogemmobacter sonorensis]|uniref:GntR family transcriptional regulator n=1 Tax=Pseudogemmobacter sonorensis TaxID=2989681 RepID=UPI0036C8C421
MESSETDIVPARAEEYGREPNQSLAQQVYRAVLNKILDGTLSPKSVVHEGKLATLLGLSRTPVREAIGKLEGEGFLVRNGRTVMVQELTLSDYLEILHMRRLLECEAAGLAAEQGSIAGAELRRLRGEIEKLDEGAGAEAHWVLDSELHDMIARGSGSRLLAQQVADLRRRTLLFGLDRLPGRLRNGRAEHLAIIDAIVAGDRAEASAAMRRHLDSTRTEVLRGLHLFE